jgi:hypothetical protein
MTVVLAEDELLRAKNIWNQVHLPVVLRKKGKGDRVRVRLPYRVDNATWLNSIGKSKPNWRKDLMCWEIPKTWFNGFVDAALTRYAKLYVIQPYIETEICAPACRSAKHHECQCSCMGENHGSGDGTGWFDVTEAFAIRFGSKRLACRLMTKKVK